MNHEINMFACAQKEQNGLDKAVEVRFKRPHGVTSGADEATDSPPAALGAQECKYRM